MFNNFLQIKYEIAKIDYYELQKSKLPNKNQSKIPDSLPVGCKELIIQKASLLFKG